MHELGLYVFSNNNEEKMTVKQNTNWTVFGEIQTATKTFIACLTRFRLILPGISKKIEKLYRISTDPWGFIIPIPCPYPWESPWESTYPRAVRVLVHVTAWTTNVESSLDICSRRRTRCTVTTAPDNGTQHPQLQPALSSAGTDKWVFSWRLKEESDSSDDRRAVGSRF